MTTMTKRQAWEDLLRFLSASDVDLPQAIERIAKLALIERDPKNYTMICTNAKYRGSDVSDFWKGWNSACRLLCNAIGNGREVAEDDEDPRHESQERKSP